MLFRSLRSLAGRALAAGAASALTLTLFNAAQPSITTHKVEPGTLKNVKVALTPAPAPTTGPAGAARTTAGSGAVSGSGAVDNATRPSSGPASVPLRGAEPGTGSSRAAPANPSAGTRLQSGPVDVGKARFVGFSWPDAGTRTEDTKVSMRTRTAAGWSAWRAVEQSGDGPDETSGEYRPGGRAYSDGQWLDAGTADGQVRVDPPAAKAGAKAAQAATAAVAANGLEAHMITPDLTATPGTEGPRAGVAPPPPPGQGSSAGPPGARTSPSAAPTPTTATPSRPPSSTTPCRATATRPRRAPP